MKAKISPDVSVFTARLLRRIIKKRVLPEPRQFVMDSFFSSRHDLSNVAVPNCGTAACLAGHTIAEHFKCNPAEARNKSVYLENMVQDEAQKFLKITHRQAARLFHVRDWPAQFGDAFYESIDPMERAKIAAARVEHFIKTGL